MTYTVHDLFYTLQGEGAQMGRPAVFIRFAGCNLWSGREQDRHKAVCQFCDTEFRGGQRYQAEALAEAAAALWPAHDEISRWIVLTGGEPALQVDAPLVKALKRRAFQVAIETNGTVHIPPIGIDWVTVSPKAGTTLRVLVAEEVKLVFPQANLEPSDVLRRVNAWHHWLSPMDGPTIRENTAAAIEYAKANPEWRVNIQAHKHWSIP